MNDQQLKAFVAMYRALAVVIKDPQIAGWLGTNDPKALEQAVAAVRLGHACRGDGAGELAAFVPEAPLAAPPLFNEAAAVPRFGSNWSHQMAAYLKAGVAEHGMEFMESWVALNMAAIVRSWGDKWKFARALDMLRSAGFSKEFVGGLEA